MSKGQNLSAKVDAQKIVDETVTAAAGLGQPKVARTVSGHVRAVLLVTRRALAVATILRRAQLEREYAATLMPPQERHSNEP